VVGLKAPTGGRSSGCENDKELAIETHCLISRVISGLIALAGRAAVIATLVPPTCLFDAPTSAPT
jgi:hypothetical protein